jgi:hypothetical protein
MLNARSANIRLLSGEPPRCEYSGRNSEFGGSVVKSLRQRRNTDKAQVNGRFEMPHRQMHDGIRRPTVVALRAFVRIEMDKHAPTFPG